LSFLFAALRLFLQKNTFQAGFRAVSLIKSIFGFTVVLASFWMISSGYFKPLLLGFGVFSVIIVIAFAWRMKNRDGESFPLIMPSWHLPGYLLWMIGQIIVSSIDVAWRVWLKPSSISPIIFTTRAGQKSEVARVIYANSITMTPGTATLSVRGDILEVHALTRKAAESLQKGEMDRRVKALEGT
jgi:multicomponent Na+:H+ antiporter subunit E